MKKEVLEFHAEFCKTLSSPKRLEILCLLKEGEMTVTEISKKIGQRTSASQHLNVMRMRGILKARRDGTNVYYGIANKQIAQACNHMQRALACLMEGVTEISRQDILALAERHIKISSGSKAATGNSKS